MYTHRNEFEESFQKTLSNIYSFCKPLWFLMQFIGFFEFYLYIQFFCIWIYVLFDIYLVVLGYTFPKLFLIPLQILSL